MQSALRPAVWVINLASGCVELGGRCWVQNKNYWKARCELLEKIKLRYDAEGIVIAYPQRDIHHSFDEGIPPTPEEDSTVFIHV